ncbi:MAG TPA: IclR family transcriptional regulator C-terminal domain-containing protein [Acidimicrobiales bacterium]|nr:IclR family transcriptional regulator C-terminal domain-containing protein [Acidimicrobiales bacterium]
MTVQPFGKAGGVAGEEAGTEPAGDGAVAKEPVAGRPVPGRPMAEGAAADGPAGYFVRSLARGLDVIKAFGSDRRQMTLSEVARVSGLTRAAARRFLLTLVDLGYVRNDSREFSLLPKVLELGHAYLSRLSLNEVAEPHLEELVALVHESSSVAVLDGDEIVYVLRVPTKRIMTAVISVGTRFPAYATSLGRVLLAYLPEAQRDAYLDSVRLEPLTKRTVTDRQRLRGILQAVRVQGYAVTDQELEEGLRSVAVPLRDGSGAVVAAANVSSHASRVSMAQLVDEILPRLVAAARLIEADLAAHEGRRKP